MRKYLKYLNPVYLFQNVHKLVCMGIALGNCAIYIEGQYKLALDGKRKKLMQAYNELNFEQDEQQIESEVSHD